MFKMRVLAQSIFLCIFSVISNVENHEKIAFMKIKKVSCGSQMLFALGPEPPDFFTWPYAKALLQKH